MSKRLIVGKNYTNENGIKLKVTHISVEHIGGIRLDCGNTFNISNKNGRLPKGWTRVKKEKQFKVGKFYAHSANWFWFLCVEVPDNCDQVTLKRTGNDYIYISKDEASEWKRFRKKDYIKKDDN